MNKFTKEALDYWKYVPEEKRKKLLAELRSQSPAIIELDVPMPQGGIFYCQARIIPLSFGCILSESKRYLSLSDIPQK